MSTARPAGQRPGRPRGRSPLAARPSRSSPFSIKTKLGTLVVVSVFITTGPAAGRPADRDRAPLHHGLLGDRHAADHPVRGALPDRAAGRDEHGGPVDLARRLHPPGARRGPPRRAGRPGLARSTAWRTTWRPWTGTARSWSPTSRTSCAPPSPALRAVLENVVDGVSAADPETMRTALKQTERLGRLVETLLDLSRLDNGVRTAARPAASRCGRTCRACSRRPTGRLRARGLASGSGSHTRTDVHLHLDVSPPELTAHADAERLHQVVANLIDNAVKHSPPHGRVTVRARRGRRARVAWTWRSWTRAPASRSRSGTGSSSGSTAAASPRRTAPAATAARVWAWRSPAGRWICTAGGSEWPNRHGAAGSSSPFRAARRRQVDVGFEAEAHDLRRITCRRAVRSGGA